MKFYELNNYFKLLFIEIVTKSNKKKQKKKKPLQSKQKITLYSKVINITYSP
jgi:hypothetical protein